MELRGKKKKLISDVFVYTQRETHTNIHVSKGMKNKRYFLNAF